MVFTAILVALAMGVWQADTLQRGVLGGERAMCRGEAATHVVQAGEELTATHEDDVIVVLGNGATVYTNLGDDLVCVYGSDQPQGSYGHGSSILAAEGSKTVITYGGSNFIQTLGSGDDFIYLNGHEEEVETDTGNDHIWALGATSARITSGGGSDLIVGSNGNDFLFAGAGSDVVLGNGGNDTIEGQDGNDTLKGGTGQDTLDGGSGSDDCEDHGVGTNFISCEEVTQPPFPPLPESI